MNEFKLSPQQEGILDWVANGSGNAFVEAVAGSGKTTSLVEICKKIPVHQSIAFTAFNKKIATEIQEKVNSLGRSNIFAGTFHSFGYRTWRNVAPKVRMDDRKKVKLMLEENVIPRDYCGMVIKMVSIAKQSAVGSLWESTEYAIWNEIINHFDILAMEPEIEADVNELIAYAGACVEWSREVGHELIDFDDMIWLPVITPLATFEKFDWVLVDEAQDTNPARRILASRMINGTGRAVWVGDRAQSIYGFTGADADAVDQIVKDFQCKQLPLTVSYRCPKQVVALAQNYVSHIQAADNASEGKVEDLDAITFLDNVAPKLEPGDAILCRLTKPLVSLAFGLLRMGVPCHVEGRDIGQGFMKLISKWKRVRSVEDLTDKLEDYRIRETQRYEKKDMVYAIEALNDRIDTLLILMEGCETVDEVSNKITRMFQDTGGGRARTVVLSTVHKAKGREWNRVFILGFHELMPSKWARQEWQQVQERNVIYVAITRSKDELVLLENLN